MTDLPETLARFRLPWRRDALSRAGAVAPYLRYAKRNPLLLAGAAVVGLAGILAWRNRERIAEAAGPVIADAKARTKALAEDARERSGDVIDQAKATGETVARKVAGVRRRAAAPKAFPDLH